MVVLLPDVLSLLAVAGAGGGGGTVRSQPHANEHDIDITYSHTCGSSTAVMLYASPSEHLNSTCTRTQVINFPGRTQHMWLGTSAPLSAASCHWDTPSHLYTAVNDTHCVQSASGPRCCKRRTAFNRKGHQRPSTTRRTRECHGTADTCAPLSSE